MKSYKNKILLESKMKSDQRKAFGRLSRKEKAGPFPHNPKLKKQYKASGPHHAPLPQSQGSWNLDNWTYRSEYPWSYQNNRWPPHERVVFLTGDLGFMALECFSALFDSSWTPKNSHRDWRKDLHYSLGLESASRYGFHRHSWCDFFWERQIKTTRISNFMPLLLAQRLHGDESGGSKSLRLWPVFMVKKYGKQKVW